MIWSLVLVYIPNSVMDGPFDTPYPVQDIRHQDAAIYQVRDVILNSRKELEEEKHKENIEEVNNLQQKGKRPSRETVNKRSNKVFTPNYELQLSGDRILAGIGRVTPFKATGDRPRDLVEVIALISSINLPAEDDIPIFFVNVCNLTDVPIEYLKQNRFTHIYTRWMISEEVRNSKQQPIQTKHLRTEVNFNDYHSVPLPSAVASDVMAIFLDVPFRVELRGIRTPLINMKSQFFGYHKADCYHSRSVPPPIPNQDVDILIAETRIDARALTKINKFVKGGFPLYPPETSVMSLRREGVCTNDINAVRAKVKPELIIPPGVILEAQMTLEVSLGLVGCKPKSDAERYSRLYCLISDPDAVTTLLREITEINASVMQTNITESKAGLLTGFVLDTGDTVMLYVEGPKQGHILRVWERTEDLYPTVKPVFSTSAQYSCRLYPELLLAAMPFNIMKMFVPLSVLLGVTPLYARPALPLPARSALLKIGSLVAGKFKTAPCGREMPTAAELKSFRLELCVTPQPPPVLHFKNTQNNITEVVGIDVWQDCNEGWLALEPPAQGVKLSYQLYPGQNFDVDVVIWPHIAKVFCGTNYGWVRTWQFLEKRWLAFSISHAFPVKVIDLRDFIVTLNTNVGIGALSANSKIDNATEVYLPPLRFGEHRQFAKVVELSLSTYSYIEEMIWFLVHDYIPTSVLDGPFDTPYPVKDVRHQDAALYQVQDVILNRREEVKKQVETVNIEEADKAHQKGVKKTKSKEAIKKPATEKYEIKLSGDRILAGIGRVAPFIATGDRPTEFGEVIALISSENLPAQDDLPVLFVNVCNLTDVPIEHLKQNRFTHIYTRWRISEEERSSNLQPIQTKHPITEVNFNDHHSVPLPSAVASDVMATFLDVPFHIELRGIRIPPPVTKKSQFFGYDIADYGRGVPPRIPNQDVDILIAETRIDATALTKINKFVKGEFPLYPPVTSVVSLEREEICTNDINAVRAKVKPDLVIPPGVILEAQMTIEVSLGLVGCKPKSNSERYSRLYCLISDHDAVMTLLRVIMKINESVMQRESNAGLLTGFILDTGDTVMVYVEGPKEGQILRVWEQTEDFYPTVKPVFSTSAKYSCRLYPELLLAAMPFIIMKMFVPLSVLLGVAPIYARPALPLPARSAVLKIGRLVASKSKSAPCCRDMPTAMELKSFRLELCVAPRPSPAYVPNIPKTKSVSWDKQRASMQSVTKFNWE